VDEPTASSSSVAPNNSAWNNCNGRQEAGESYSAECETKQRSSTDLDTIPAQRPKGSSSSDEGYSGGDSAENSDDSVE
jgi:hypothetical protein